MMNAARARQRTADALKAVTPLTARKRLLRSRLATRLLTANMRLLPDFVILGGQRCGTSSLYKYLGRHPQMAPSLRKETEYFTIDFDKGESWYRAHFPLEIRRTVCRGGRWLGWEYDAVTGLVGSVTVVSGIGLACMGLGGLGAASVGFVLSAARGRLPGVELAPSTRLSGRQRGLYDRGVVLAYGVLSSSSGGIATVALVATSVMGVFFVDLAATVLRRKLNGRPLFAGDRSHIYDQLRSRGWSIRSVALFAAATQGVLTVLFVGLALIGGGLAAATISIVLGTAIVLVTLWRLGFLAPVSR